MVASDITVKFRKKIPEVYIFQMPFFRGLFLEGLIFEGKFSMQHQLGLYWERIFRLKIDWSSLKVEGNYISVICGTFLLKLP